MATWKCDDFTAQWNFCPIGWGFCCHVAELCGFAIPELRIMWRAGLQLPGRATVPRRAARVHASRVIGHFYLSGKALWREHATHRTDDKLSFAQPAGAGCVLSGVRRRTNDIFVAPTSSSGRSNLGTRTSLMHGVAPQMCDQVTRPLLGGEAGGRSPGFLLSNKRAHPRRSWRSGQQANATRQGVKKGERRSAPNANSDVTQSGDHPGRRSRSGSVLII